MKTQFEILKFSRTRILELIEGLSVEQLNKIPEGLHHNITWSIGHILASQQLFMYKHTGLPFIMDEALVHKYKGGTYADVNTLEKEINYLREQLTATYQSVTSDYNRRKFKQFNSFVTKRGVAIDTIEDAITFHTFHEGVHVGWIWQIQKLV